MWAQVSAGGYWTVLCLSAGGCRKKRAALCVVYGPAPAPAPPPALAPANDRPRQVRGSARSVALTVHNARTTRTAARTTVPRRAHNRAAPRAQGNLHRLSWDPRARRLAALQCAARHQLRAQWHHHCRRALKWSVAICAINSDRLLRFYARAPRTAVEKAPARSRSQSTRPLWAVTAPPADRGLAHSAPRTTAQRAAGGGPASRLPAASIGRAVAYGLPLPPRPPESLRRAAVRPSLNSTSQLRRRPLLAMAAPPWPQRAPLAVVWRTSRCSGRAAGVPPSAPNTPRVIGIRPMRSWSTM